MIDSCAFNNDEFYMNFLLDYAWRFQALALPNPSVGAMLLDKNNAIVSVGVHESYGAPHAELLACKNAYIARTNDTRLRDIHNPFEIYDFLLSHHGGIFHDMSMFVTLSPCAHVGKTPSCARLLCELKPKRVVICTRDSTQKASGGAEILAKEGIEVVENVLNARGEDLLFPFYCMQNGRFFLYKFAARLNGTIDGGVISSLDSRIYTHKIRNVIDRLIISQKTILLDNPILDSRLINGKAPHVAIVGKSKKIKESSRLFDVPNRNVEFFSSLSLVPQNGFNLIEGGSEFFTLVREMVDCLLVFIAPQMANGLHMQSEFSGRILHVSRIGEDIALWVQKS